MSKHLSSQSNLENLKKQAKSLLKALQGGDPSAIKRFSEADPSFPPASLRVNLTQRIGLRRAQNVIAREYGYQSWGQLTEAVRLHDRIRRFVEERFLEAGEQEPLGRSSSVSNLLDQARKAAIQDRSLEVRPLHILRALGGTEGQEAEVLSEETGLKVGELRMDLRRLDGQMKEDRASGHIPVAAETEAVLKAAESEAREMNRAEVDLQALILGLTSNSGSDAARLLSDLGVTYWSIKKDVAFAQTPLLMKDAGPSDGSSG